MRHGESALYIPLFLSQASFSQLAYAVCELTYPDGLVKAPSPVGGRILLMILEPGLVSILLEPGLGSVSGVFEFCMEATIVRVKLGVGCGRV